MKKTLIFASILSISLYSCGEKSTSTDLVEEVHATGDGSTAKGVKVQNSTTTTSIIDAYLAVKDALVADNPTTASAKSAELVVALESYDIATAKANDPEELERLQQEAIRLSKSLSSGDIAAQRENFQTLSGTLKDLLKIAGTDRTLYHQYCPMYKGNTGGMWLSANEEIKNPLFGSSMLTCGRVEETLSMN
jgi:Tfp pilus assembly protein PilW